MPDNRKKMRVSVDIEGDLTASFLVELGKRVAAGGTESKADLGRVLMAEALRARGHHIDIPETVWGRFKTKSEMRTAGRKA